MHPMGNARRHYFLTIGMAGVCGVSLTAALRDGLITRQDFADWVARCRTCDDPEGCARWIDARRLDEAQTAPPPAYCSNGALLAELGRL